MVNEKNNFSTYQKNIFEASKKIKPQVFGVIQF